MSEPAEIKLPGLSLPAKLLCTAYLCAVGLGMVFGMPKIFFAHNMADGKPMLTPRDLVLTYYGDPEHPKIEQVLKITVISGHDNIGGTADKLIGWTKAGAPQDQFEDIKDILDTYCVNCHSPGAAAGSAPFQDYETVKGIFASRGGMPWKRLLTLSHTHMLGTSAVFMLASLIVLFSSLRPGLKGVLMLLPFAAIVMDIGSWWLAAYVSPVFVYTIIAGGALLGISFLLQFIACMQDLWLRRPTEEEG